MFPLYDEDSYSRFSLITAILIFVNTFIFFFSLRNPIYIIEKYALLPKDFLAFKNVYTVFTAMFLHGNIWHLLGNMWFLWVFGNSLEKGLGKIKYLFFYLICGIIAGGIYCFITQEKTIPLIGASGAISGILGGYFVLYPRHKIRTLFPLFFIVTVVSLPAIIFLIFWILFQILYPEPGVAILAHLIGFFSGAILVNLFKKR
jgi:membrane associated rhomboid family serine protease